MVAATSRASETAERRDLLASTAPVPGIGHNSAPCGEEMEPAEVTPGPSTTVGQVLGENSETSPPPKIPWKPPPGFDTDETLAKEFEVTPRTVRAWRRRDGLPFVKLGKRVLIPRPAFLKYLEKRTA